MENRKLELLDRFLIGYGDGLEELLDREFESPEKIEAKQTVVRTIRKEINCLKERS